MDVWSALGATSWSFGDGGSAAGTAVSHTYAAAGTYEVTVTAVDALGNTSSDSGTIAVAPAPVAPTPSPLARTGMAFAAHLARVKGGRALLRLRCRGAGRCRGLVKLLLGRKLIGKARFSIAAGKAKVVRVRLNRRDKKLLARRHRLKAKLRGSGVKFRTVLLKQVQHKRRRR